MKLAYLIQLREELFLLRRSEDKYDLVELSEENISLELYGQDALLVATAGAGMPSSVEELLVDFDWFAVTITQAVIAGLLFNDLGVLQSFDSLARKLGAVLQFGRYGYFGVMESGLVTSSKVFEIPRVEAEKLERLPKALLAKNDLEAENTVVCGFGISEDYSIIERGLDRLATRYDFLRTKQLGKGSEANAGASEEKLETGESDVMEEEE